MSAEWEVREGEALDRLREFADGSVDAIVTDPPYGLEFMGKDWDRLDAVSGGASFAATGYTDGERLARPSFTGSPNPPCANCGGTLRGRDRKGFRVCRCDAPSFPNHRASQGRAMQAWHEAWACEALRVLKPGGYLLAFGGTRTYHRLACAVEDAGFEIRDEVLSIFEATDAGRRFLASLTPEQIAALDKLGGGPLAWLYGSGFPKSLDVSKAIDKAAGAEREVVGARGLHRWSEAADGGNAMKDDGGIRQDFERVNALTAPATPEGVEWDGWGTALKPAHEPIVVARKPLVGTVVGNVLEHGTGALNVEGCRVGTGGGTTRSEQAAFSGDAVEGEVHATRGWRSGHAVEDIAAGRWPANVVLSHGEDCVLVGCRSARANGHFPAARGASGYGSAVEGSSGGGLRGQDGLEERRFDGELVEVWACVPGCPVRMLDEQNGEMRARGNARPTTAGGGLYGLPIIDADHGAGDRGGASRFFLATQRHKIEGCEVALTAEQSSGHADARRASAQSDVAIAASREATASSGYREHITTETLLRSNESGGNDMQRIPGFASALSLARRQGALSPNVNHASSVETREPTGITMTTTSRSRSDGSVGAAISEDTPLNAAAGELGLRFRYCAKASSAERQAGLEERNEHPTVKPIDLMRWLVRLVTPPGGLVVDPFVGSGTTGCAAVLEGFRFVGVERETEYVALARGRIGFWVAHPTALPIEAALAAESVRRRTRDAGQLGLDV